MGDRSPGPGSSTATDPQPRRDVGDPSDVSVPADSRAAAKGGTRSGWASLTAVLAATVAVVAVVVVLLVEVVGFGAPSNDGTGGVPDGFRAVGTHDYGRAPSYTLIDQHGQRFSSAQLAGKVQVVSYLFPYCTNYCPLTARVMKLAEDRLRSAGLMGRVAFVAFDVDPGDTGPAQERAFLSEYGISPNDPAWHFLTGTPEQVRRVVYDGFHIYYQKVSLASERRDERRQKRQGNYHPQPEAANPLASRAAVDYDVVHNDSIEIVGPSGRIVYYTGFGDRVTAGQIAGAVRAAVPR